MENQLESRNMDIKNTSSKLKNFTTNKTKKKQTPQLSNLEKSRLWDLLDNDKSAKTDSSEMECVYKSNMESCASCESSLVTMEDGFPTCSNKECGRFYRDVLDFSAEWRYYGADDKNSNDPTRCGNPINPLLQESSYGCKVLYTNKSSYEMRRIGRWTEWQSIPHKEKSLYNEFMHISTMAQNGGISKICIDEALVIHKDISEQKMFRGCNRAGTIAASIYIACRLNECPRTAHELAEIFHLDKTSATNGCSLALDMLNNVERNNGCEEQSNLCSTAPQDFIERYCSRLNMSKKQTMLCMFVAKKVENENLIPDNTPNSIAAGIVYFVCQLFELNKSKTEIKSICGVSEVTINKCYKKLEVIKENVVPSCFLASVGCA
jgi:transcription initiation factor TFIIB